MRDRRLKKLDEALEISALQFTLEQRVPLSDTQRAEGTVRATKDVLDAARRMWRAGRTAELADRLVSADRHEFFKGEDSTNWVNFIAGVASRGRLVGAP